jgi:hypothetical protein
MPSKFNFLDRRTASAKAEEQLRRKFPNRSNAWINARAQQLAQQLDISNEAHAGSSSKRQRGNK